MNTQNLVGQATGQYELQEQLGISGMVSVYHAHQKVLNLQITFDVLPVISVSTSHTRRFVSIEQEASVIEHKYTRVPIHKNGGNSIQDWVSAEFLRND